MMRRVSPRTEAEVPLWEGSPSLVTIFPLFVICLAFFFLIFPLVLLAYYWIDTRKTSYVLTTQRLIVTSGVFGRRVEEVELFRIRDIELQASFLERLCSVGTVRVHSNDRTAPVLAIEGVRGAGRLKETVRTRVAMLRETVRRIS